MKAQQQNIKWIVNLQICLMIGIMFAPLLTGFRFHFPQDVFDWLGTITSIFGNALLVLSVRALKKTFTYDTAVKKETKLATDFPFNVSRNPTYLGGLMMCFSWSLLQRSYLAAVLTILLTFVLNRKVGIEEKNLELVFKNEYLNYKARVRRFL